MSLLVHAVEWVRATPLPSPSSTVSPSTPLTPDQAREPGTPWTGWATLGAAAIAALVALYAATMQRKSGREAAEAARKSAAAAEKAAGASENSSKAALRSAAAAEANVDLGERSAAATAERLKDEGYAKRYQDAASQLGSKKAAIRLAGVYSMARLADDWQEQRQTCIEVLCAYLRISASTDRAEDVRHDERQVQDAIVGLVVDHLDRDAVASKHGVSWADHWIDFSGIEVENFSLVNAELSAGFTMNYAVFTGRTEFHGIRIPESGLLSLNGSVVKGDMTMTLDDLEGIAFLENVCITRDAQLAAQINIGPLAEDVLRAKRLMVEGYLRLGLLSESYEDRNEVTYEVDLSEVTVGENGTVLVDLMPPYRPPITVHLQSWTVREYARVELPESIRKYVTWRPKMIDPRASVNWGQPGIDN